MRLLFLLLLATVGAACSRPPAVSAEQRAVEARLADLLAAAAATHVSAESLAPFMVARGDNTRRRWKAPADLSDPSERAYVENVQDELETLLERVRLPGGGMAYETEEFVVEPESEGLWHVLRVEFEHPRGPVEALFAFLPLHDTYYLGEIER